METTKNQYKSTILFQIPCLFFKLNVGTELLNNSNLFKNSTTEIQRSVPNTSTVLWPRYNL